MLLAWRTIGVIQLSEQWQLTNISATNLYRITHTIDGNPSGTLRAAIGQETESIIFDRRLIGYRPGVLEGQLFIKPDGIENRRLALQRLDKDAVNWLVKIEELIDLATSLPLPISDIDGLQDALDSKASTDALAEKAAVEHIHEIADIDGLLDLIESLEPINNVISSVDIPSSVFEGLIWNELDENNSLIESWFYLNSRWQSITKYSLDYWAPTSSISGSTSYNIAMDDRYDYLFKDFLVNCIYSGAGTVDGTTNYWRAIVTTQPTGTTFANSGAIPNDSLSRRFSLNQIFQPAQGERLLLMYQKYGSPPGVKIGVNLRYHLLRK
ncbi:hypothetical protein NIES4101_28830 [Calothrix sp. NIES-4101]|nr:hypothetical protein NIES4101_28830 [Calothrix sp. NIES-4101]